MSKTLLPDSLPVQDASRASVPPLDTSKYKIHMDGLGLSEAQETEFLTTLWWIMAAFVDLGFGVDSVQQFLPDLAKLSSEFGAHALHNNHAETAGKFNEAASDEAGKDEYHDE